MVDDQRVMRTARGVQLKCQSLQVRFTQPGPAQQRAVRPNTVQSVGNKSKIHGELQKSVMGNVPSIAKQPGSPPSMFLPDHGCLNQVRMGSGIFVIGRESVRMLDNAPGPLEIIRARKLIEGELAAVAARSKDRSLVGDLNESLREMERDIAARTLPIHGDRSFHIRIAQASDNSVLQAVVTQLFDERNSPLSAQLGSHFEREATWMQAVDEHRTVIEAIALHDPEKARMAMGVHLDRSHQRFSAGWTTPGK